MINFLPGWSVRANSTRIPVETKQKYIRDVITVLGLEEAKPCDDSECEEDGNDRVTR